MPQRAGRIRDELGNLAAESAEADPERLVLHPPDIAHLAQLRVHLDEAGR